MSGSLATAGQVMIAIDEPWHGDPEHCAGSGALLTSAGVPAPANQGSVCLRQLTRRADPDVQRGRPLPIIDRSGALACNPAAPDADKACMLAGQGHCAADSRV
jgi:hypothetical protein